MDLHIAVHVHIPSIPQQQGVTDCGSNETKQVFACKLSSGLVDIVSFPDVQRGNEHGLVAIDGILFHSGMHAVYME